jgi:hypothetical protein
MTSYCTHYVCMLLFLAEHQAACESIFQVWVMILQACDFLSHSDFGEHDDPICVGQAPDERSVTRSAIGRGR